jgi:hypothetical protein
MKTPQKILLVLIVALVGYAIGRYAQPAKVIKEIKEVEVEKVRTEYRTIVKTVTKPDGTKEVTETTENININESTSISESKTTIENIKPQWRLGALAGIEVTSSDFIYGAQVERRVLGPFFMGAWGLTNNQHKAAGLSVSMEF